MVPRRRVHPCRRSPVSSKAVRVNVPFVMAKSQARKIRELLLHEDESTQRQGVALLQALGDSELWRRVLKGQIALERDDTDESCYRLGARRLTGGLVEAFFSVPNGDFSHVRRLRIEDTAWPRRISYLDGLQSLVNLADLSVYATHELNDISGLGSLTKLKALDIFGGRFESVAALGKLTELEQLELRSCSALTSIAPLANASKLRSLKLYYCKSLRSLKGIGALRELDFLQLGECAALGDVSELLELEGLRQLQVSSSPWLERFEMLPTGLNELELTHVKSLSPRTDLAHIKGLRKLAFRFSKLPRLRHPSLETLETTDLNALAEAELPRLRQLVDRSRRGGDAKVLSNLPALERLDLQNVASDVSCLASFERLRELRLGTVGSEQLNIDGFPALSSLNITNTSACKSLLIRDCEQLDTVELVVSGQALEAVRIDGCPRMAQLVGLCHHKHLRSLRVVRCGALSQLDVNDCRSLGRIELSGLTGLRSLRLRECGALPSAQALEPLSQLETLDLTGCVSLTSLRGLEQLTLLRQLSLRACTRLTEVNELKDLRYLSVVDLTQCRRLTNAGALAALRRLRFLYMSCCASLSELRLHNNTELLDVDVSYCRRLEYLEGLGRLQKLQRLNVRHCHSLRLKPTDLAALPGLSIAGLGSVSSPQGHSLPDASWCLFSPLELSPERVQQVLLAAAISYPCVMTTALADPDEAIEQVECLVFDQLDEILHHPQLAELEARWRCLWQLACQVGREKNIRLEMLSCSAEDLLVDFEDSPEIRKCGLYKILYSGEYGSFGGTPYGLLLVDYEINPSPQARSMLSQCGEVAQLAHLVVAAPISPQWFGVESLDELASELPSSRLGEPAKIVLNVLRNSLGAQHIVLTAGRLRLREPYGHTATYPEAGHGADLFGCGIVAVAERLIASFERYGWGLHLPGPLTGLNELSSAEVCWSSAQRDDLEKLGLLALGCSNAEGQVDLSKTPVLASGPAGQPDIDLCNILMATRLMQCSKVIARENIGSWKKTEDQQAELNAWLSAYTVAGEPMGGYKPFVQARVEFIKQQEYRNHYVMHLTPTWQRDGRPWSLRFNMLYDNE